MKPDRSHGARKRQRTLLDWIICTGRMTGKPQVRRKTDTTLGEPVEMSTENTKTKKYLSYGQMRKVEKLLRKRIRDEEPRCNKQEDLAEICTNELGFLVTLSNLRRVMKESEIPNRFVCTSERTPSGTGVKARITNLEAELVALIAWAKSNGYEHHREGETEL